jgi:hypothetical protein
MCTVLLPPGVKPIAVKNKIKQNKNNNSNNNNKFHFIKETKILFVELRAVFRSSTVSSASLVAPVLIYSRVTYPISCTVLLS